MTSEFCPNCSGYLMPFEYEGRTEGYCPNNDCQYATVYDDKILSAFNIMYQEDFDSGNWKEWGINIKGKPNWKKQTEKIVEPEFKVNTINEFKSKPNIQIKEIQKPLRYEIRLENIIGYDPIKTILRKIINHKGRKRIHGLIVGAAGTSKTVFLKSLESELVPQGCSVHYVDAATLTKRGLADYIFDHDDIDLLLIDEIDKVTKDHQAIFLNMLESGVLQTTSFNNIRKKEVKDMTVVSTGNYLEKIIEPVRTRFLTMYLKAYTKEEYLDVCARMLVNKYPYISKELAEFIALESYTHVKPVSMRTADRLGNIIRENPTKQAVKETLQGLITYAIPQDILNKLDSQT